MSFEIGNEPADNMRAADFVDALAMRCNVARAAALKRWKLQLEQHDIETVQELKMVMNQVVRQMFADADVGDGAQAMIRLALAPQSPSGWNWVNAAKQGNTIEKSDKIKPTWDTSAKYTPAAFKGDLNKFVFPEGSFDEWPPCDILPYKDMVAVGTRAWTLINTHPELKGGGITPAAARRVASLLAMRYKNLEPVGKHESRNNTLRSGGEGASKEKYSELPCACYPQHMRLTSTSHVFRMITKKPRTWETYLHNRFKNARQVVYKNTGMTQEDVKLLDPCVRDKVPFLPHLPSPIACMHPLLPHSCMHPLLPYSCMHPMLPVASLLCACMHPL